MSDVAQQDGPPPGAPVRSVATAPRWMKWLLVASLALNLLIIGIVAGAALRFDRGGRGGKLTERIERFARQLPPERRDRVLNIVESRMPEIRSLFDEAKDARRQLTSLVASDEFEPAAFAKQSEATEQAYGRLRNRLTGVLGELSAQLNAEERRELLQYWRRRGRRR